MTDIERQIADFLHEEADRAAMSPGMYQRVIRRAGIRRMVTASVTGLVVIGVAIGGVVAAGALRSPSSVGPARPEEASPSVSDDSGSLFALWPEHTLEAGAQAQARADAGQDAWRLDPSATAERFAEEILGWKDVIVRTCPFEQERNCEPAESQPGSSFRYLSRTQGTSDLILRLEQLRRGEGGIWSVSWVGDAGEDLPAGFERPLGIEEDPAADIAPGGEIPAGGTVLLRSSRPGAEDVIAGYIYWGPCQTEGFSSTVRKRSVFLEFRVAERDVEDACIEEEGADDGSSLARPVDGIVFAASIRSGSVDAARLGVWLFDPSQRTSDAAAALAQIVDIAAMPVRFVP